MLDMTPLGWLGRKTSTQTNKPSRLWSCSKFKFCAQLSGLGEAFTISTLLKHGIISVQKYLIQQQRHPHIYAHTYIKTRTHTNIYPAHDKTYNKMCGTSRDSDQPAHCTVWSVHWSRQFYSQAIHRWLIRVCWSHRSCRFCRVLGHIVCVNDWI